MECHIIIVQISLNKAVFCLKSLTYIAVIYLTIHMMSPSLG